MAEHHLGYSKKLKKKTKTHLVEGRCLLQGMKWNEWK
jgi:hypothetical protein